MVKEATRREVQQLMDRGAQVVDVLPSKEFDDSRLPGAVSLPLDKLSEQAPSQLDRARPIVVYCYDSLCDMSPRGVARLESLGFGDVQERLGDWDLCLVVNDDRLVLGLVRAEALAVEPGRRVSTVMQEAPRTDRPHMTPGEIAGKTGPLAGAVAGDHQPGRHAGRCGLARRYPRRPGRVVAWPRSYGWARTGSSTSAGEKSCPLLPRPVCSQTTHGKGGARDG